MSIQLKNASKPKAFFLLHGEKIGVGLIALLAGWLVYASTGQESEDRQPSELSSLVQQTTNRMNGFTWEEALEADPPPPLAEDFQAAADETILADQYAVSRQGWNPSPVPPIVLRRDPVLLPPVALEGHGYTLLVPFYSDANAKRLALEQRAEEERLERDRAARSRLADDESGRRGRNADDDLESGRNARRRQGRSNRRQQGASLNGDELIEIRSCAVVLAKVPVMDQLKVYRDTFENALGYQPAKDIPDYLGFFVERAEVRSDGELKWEPARLRNGQGGKSLRAVTEDTIVASVADWVEEAEPLLDDRYFHPVLTFPLPGLVDRNWGPEVVHSGLPLASDSDSSEDDAEDPDALSPLDDEEDDLFGGANSGRTSERASRRQPGRRLGSRGNSEQGERSHGPAKRGIRGPRGSRGGRQTEDFAADFMMARYLDFDVRPGRRYKYRFRLILLDANGKGQTRGVYLEKDVKKRVDATKRTRLPFVMTEWSEPSRAISIPLAGSVLVAEAQQSVTSGTTVNLVVQSFGRGDDGRAMQGAIEKEKIRPGSVMNMRERDVEILDKGYWTKMDFTFRTGVTLLDVEGGRKLSKKITAPASVLLMDATGRLRVRDQVSDQSEVRYHRELRSEEEDTGGGGSYEDFGY